LSSYSRAESLAVDNSRVKSLTSLFLSLSLSPPSRTVTYERRSRIAVDRVLGNDERLIRVASTADTASGWSIEPSFPPRRTPRLSHARSGDTTSVSRTPQDEQQPIPRFIGLFAYMLQGCVTRQMTPATAARDAAESWARLPSRFPSNGVAGRRRGDQAGKLLVLRDRQ